MRCGIAVALVAFSLGHSFAGQGHPSEFAFLAHFRYKKFDHGPGKPVLYMIYEKPDKIQHGVSRQYALKKFGSTAGTFVFNLHDGRTAILNLADRPCILEVLRKR